MSVLLNKVPIGLLDIVVVTNEEDLVKSIKQLKLRLETLIDGD